MKDIENEASRKMLAFLESYLSRQSKLLEEFRAVLCEMQNAGKPNPAEQHKRRNPDVH